MAKVFELPKQSRATRVKAEQARQAIQDIDLSDEARAVIENAIYLITDNPGERAVFTMINNDQFLYVSQKIMDCRNVATTFAVWNVAITCVRQDTGEILASRSQLAEKARTHPNSVSNAMADLEKIGAILKEKRGRNVVYKVNPHVAWNGGEGARLAAAKNVPRLRLVSSGDIDPVADHIAARATEYLRSCDWQTRRKWAKRAVALGSDNMPAMTANENLAAWSRWVALELVSERLIGADL
jgi:hypothetical protein